MDLLYEKSATEIMVPNRMAPTITLPRGAVWRALMNGEREPEP